MFGGMFAPLTIMNNDVVDMISVITIFNTAVTETATDNSGKHRQKKKQKKKLGHSRNYWSKRQKERTEKEKILFWRILKLQWNEQQDQEVHEKS